MMQELEDTMAQGHSIDIRSNKVLPIQRHTNFEDKDQYFFGHGKLLLSGEYFVLDGAQALALPTKVGQSLSVKYSPSFSPKLTWKSFDLNGDLWFEATYEFWHFNCLDADVTPDRLFLQKVLKAARAQNTHFLRDDVDVYVETRLGFPLSWGLGSSSSLIYNVAQWAYVSAFELSFKTYGGSGYDIACAQSEGPITYRKGSSGPSWGPVTFEPAFKEQLYFVYLGQKQDSRTGIARYEERVPEERRRELAEQITKLTESMLTSKTLAEFEEVIRAHESIVSEALELPRARDLHFSDYWGEVKSLGAWGGDFVLVTSERSLEETKSYFKEKGHNVFITYSDLICATPSVLPTFAEGLHGKLH